MDICTLLHEIITIYPQYLCPCTNIHNPCSLSPNTMHPMWAVTTSVILPARVDTNMYSTQMILSGMGRAVGTRLVNYSKPAQEDPL